MIKALSMEFYKIRHRKLGLTILAVIIVQFIYALWQMKYKNSHELSQGWMDSIYSFATINCIIMPMLVAVIGSRLSDIEHKGNTFKLLMTVMPSKQLFISKILCGGFYLLISVLLQVVMMICIGSLRGITQEFPVGYFCYYGLFTFLVNLTLLLLQLILSLQFLNQMIAFCVAIGGTFLGLYSLFFEKAGKYVLWAYYMVLSPARVDWDKSTRIVKFYWISIPLYEFFALLISLVLLYIIGKKLFMRKEF
jgi:hypothetical protein